MKFNFDSKPTRSAHAARNPQASVGKTVTSNVGGTSGTGGGGGGGFPGGGSGRNLTAGGQYDVTRYNPVHDHLEIGSLIEDWMPRDASGLHQMWRLIYLRDAIVGPTVDLYSNLPYSEFRLTGIDDPAILRIYQETMERLDVVTAMPELVKEFLTIGKFCSSLIFDSRQGGFTGWTHHDPDFLRIEPVPVNGFDPKLDLVASPALKNFLHSMDDRDLAIKEQLPESYLSELEKQGTYKLNPLSTLFVPRRSAPYDSVGTSFLTRIVSFWALEKSLIESTVTNARRRTRSILHINAGLENLWEPTEEELEAISGLFIQADEDPVGAVVTTRTGVETNEIRAGNDFWKLSDEWAFLTEGKMRALGVSDAFLSGDACVTGDTLVQTSEGLIEIEKIGEMGSNPVTDKHGDWKDIDITVRGHHETPKAVKWLYNGIKPTLLIEAEKGLELTCTHNHKLLVFREKLGRFEEVRADHLREGDYLCSPTNDFSRREVLKLDLSDPSNVFHGGQRKDLTKPAEMGTDLAYLLGLIVSEASIIKKQSQIRFSNSSEKLLNKFACIIKNIFNLDVTISRHKTGDPTKNQDRPNSFNSTKNCFDLIICSKTLIEWLEELGCYTGSTKDSLDGKPPSYHKEIPWSILQADKKSQMAFLAGFIDGDGSINQKACRISIISASKKLINQVQNILLINGIRSAKVQKGDYCQALQLYSLDTINLWNGIAEFVVEKSFKVDSVKKRSFFGIPLEWLHTTTASVGGPVVGKLRQLKKLPYDKDQDAIDKIVLSISNNSNELSYRLLEFLDLKYDFVKVKSITDAGEQKVYDLSTEENSSHLIVGNGLIYHQTYNNMETALSVFMESLRTLRSYMDRRVFYEKIFATLARVHGFTKKDSKSRGPTSLHRTMDYRKALKIPKEDLLMPKIVWDKKLQPEGDMNFLEMLQTADEAGVPITMKQWASGAGLNLEEMMEDLPEDARNRKKIAEWRKQFTGDQAMEQEVMSGEGLRSIPVWDDNNNFVVLSSTEALNILEHFLETRHNMLKLTSPNETMRTISSMVDGHALKTELMAYLLRRLGVGTELPIEGRAVEAIGEHLCKIGKSSDSPIIKKAVHAEFQTLARVMSKDIPKERKLALLEGMSKKQDMTPFTPKAVTGV